MSEEDLEKLADRSEISHPHVFAVLIKGTDSVVNCRQTSGRFCLFG